MDKYSFNPVEFQTHILSCVGFTSLYRNCSDTSLYLCVKIFFDYTFPCSSFDFAIGFERTWFKRHFASKPLTVYNMAGHIDVTTWLLYFLIWTLAFLRWQISNWSIPGMFSLIHQSLSANSQIELCFRALGI